MKLNIANPHTGQQKTVEIDDEKKLIPFIEKRMGQDVPGDSLGDEFKGYSFRITGGNDKQGFPMMQGVLCNNRVRLLFRKGMKCFRPRRSGQLKRKSVRGCIVGHDLAVMSLTVAKKGDNDIPGLTDETLPRRLGPKRAAHIRKLFNLSKEDDACLYVVRRNVEQKDGKIKSKAPRIQRLITDARIQHKRYLKVIKQRRHEKAATDKKEYETMMNKYRQEVVLAKRKSDAEKKKKGIDKSSGATGTATTAKPAVPAQTTAAPPKSETKSSAAKSGKSKSTAAVVPVETAAQPKETQHPKGSTGKKK